MIEAVLRPGPGQISVHTPFVMRAGRDIYLFYGRCDAPLIDQHKFKICYAVSRDGLHFVPNPDPIIEIEPSVCRPWVIPTDEGYRMYFVRQLSYPGVPIRFRIYTATSRDLKDWDVLDRPVIDGFDRLEYVASPCIVQMQNKVRMYLTAAKRHGRQDCIYVAESHDGVSFKLRKGAIYGPEPGTGYSASCYTPCVYRNGQGWKMLFSGAGEDGRYSTFLCESRNGLKFSEGESYLDLSTDPRFTYAAYKAVRFEDHVYLVGAGLDRKTTIYRMRCSV